MSELAPEFKQKIANFDGNNTVNEKEKHVMFYVESYAKNMPPAYLNKLISAIEVKLKDKELSKDQIRQECENARILLNEQIKKGYAMGIDRGAVIDKESKAKSSGENLNKEILHAKESCLRNKFDPASINGANTLKYFEYLANNPKEEQQLTNAFAQDKSLHLGFVRYILLQKQAHRINDKSSLSRIGGENNIGVLWMNRQIENFSKAHKDINITQLELGNNQAAGVKNIDKEIEKEKGFLDAIGNVYDKKGIAGVAEKILSRTDEALFETNKKSALAVNTKLGLPLDNNLDINGFSDKGLHGFNTTEGNYFISIQDFENKLKSNTQAVDINSRALSNYFQYLHTKGQLNPTKLVQTFGGDILLGLGVIWKNGGNTIDSKYSLLAYQKLKENNLQYAIDTVIKLSSTNNKVHQIENLKDEKELDVAILLLQEKGNKYKTEFKNELKAGLQNKGFSESEITKKVEKLLQDLMECTGKDGVARASKIMTQYDKENHTKTDKKGKIQQVGKIQSTENELLQAKNKKDYLGTTDPVKKAALAKQQITLKKDEQKIKESNLISNAITISQLENLGSGKITIDKVIEELQSTNKDFAKEYTTWKKETQEYKKQEKKDATKEKDPKKQESKTKEKEPEDITKEKQIPDSGSIKNIFSPTRLATMKIGEEKEIPLSKEPGAQKIHYKKTAANFYDIQIGEHNKITLPGSGLRGYVGSYKLLQNTGLEPMINIEPAILSNIIASCSKGAKKADNTDGFSQEERVMFLKSMANVLGVGEKIEHEYNYHTVCTAFKNALTLNKPNTSPKDGFKTLAISKGFLSDDGLVISSTNLLSAIKNQKKST